MISVLLSTYNRARILASVLETHCGTKSPQRGWELLVVDNASTDHTKETVQSFQTRLPLVYLYEPTQGKNSALNLGLAHVRGDLVVFTDDDVFPRADWLVQYERLAESRHDYDLFGGVTLPRWEAPPPDWILSWVSLGPTFTLSPPTLKDGLSVPENTFGTNYAIRGALFQAGHRFDVEIGPRGTSYAMGSETQFIRKLFREGHAIWHSNDVVVEHWVEAEKLNKAWVLKRAQRYGRGQYRLEMEGHDEVVSSWFGIPRYMFRQLPSQYLQVLKAKLEGDPRRAFESEWQLMVTLGTFQEARIMAKVKGQGPAKPTWA